MYCGSLFNCSRKSFNDRLLPRFHRELRQRVGMARCIILSIYNTADHITVPYGSVETIHKGAPLLHPLNRVLRQTCRLNVVVCNNLRNRTLIAVMKCKQSLPDLELWVLLSPLGKHSNMHVDPLKRLLLLQSLPLRSHCQTELGAVSFSLAPHPKCEEGREPKRGWRAEGEWPRGVHIKTERREAVRNSEARVAYRREKQ